jgi:hypothetical protein
VFQFDKSPKKLVGSVVLLLPLAVFSMILIGPQSSASLQQATGCPEHRQPAPVFPRDVPHHECCQAGHQTAIVREVASFRLSLLSLEMPVDSAQPVLPERLSGHLKIGPAFPDKPPSTDPLRI